jgi:hypothetical protein
MHPAPLPSLLSPALGAERAALERFVAERFLRVYGARLSHFCAHLVGLRGAGGAWRAAAGYTPAGSKSLFLEQYLDAPVEALLAAASGRPVARERIAEVGNLAAAVGMGRELIPAVGAHLHALGYRWVVFTATRQLHNAFRRLRLDALELADAAPSRLPDHGASWGTYYAHGPRVMGGPIAACLRAGLKS